MHREARTAFRNDPPATPLSGGGSNGGGNRRRQVYTAAIREFDKELHQVGVAIARKAQGFARALPITGGKDVDPYSIYVGVMRKYLQMWHMPKLKILRNILNLVEPYLLANPKVSPFYDDELEEARYAYVKPALQRLLIWTYDHVAKLILRALQRACRKALPLYLRVAPEAGVVSSTSRRVEWLMGELVDVVGETPNRYPNGKLIRQWRKVEEKMI